MEALAKERVSIQMISAPQPPAPVLRPTRADRLVALAIGACFLGLSLWLGFQIQDHAKRPEYLIPKAGEIMVLVAIIANMAGSVAAVALPRGWVIFVTATAFLFLFFGILFTLIGILLVVLGAGLIFLAHRLLVWIRPAHRRAILTIGGLMALSMTLLFMAWNHPPLIDCSTGRVSASYWYWGGGPDSSSGSSHAAPDGETRGTQTFDGKTYSYVCRGGELLDFTTSTH